MSNVVSTFQRTEDEALRTYVNDMAAELRELKETLHKVSVGNQDNPYQSEGYFEFVTKLRGKMKANVEKKYYPTIRIDGMELGIDFQGLLYDKSNNRTLPRALAFSVYQKLYDYHVKKPYFK